MSHGQTGHRGLFQSGAATVLCTRADGGADIQVYKAVVEFVQSQEGFWHGRPGEPPQRWRIS